MATYIGTSGNDTVWGGLFSDSLFGLGGNDILVETGPGHLGNDTLNGGTGNDTMYGGVGDDLYYVDSTSDLVVESFSEGRDEVRSTVTWTLGEHQEVLRLTGTAAINGFGNGEQNWIYGNSAANQLDGGAGSDLMAGGDGSDTYYVDNAADTIMESSSTSGGYDWVYSSVTWTLGGYQEVLSLTGSGLVDGYGNDLKNILYGNSAANRLDALGNDDFIIAYAGNDTLIGGTGNNTMYGGDGDDVYYVDSWGDVVSESSSVSGGIDEIYATNSWTLGDYQENLVLMGDGGDGFGNNLNNRLAGNDDGNLLSGLDGDDYLYGYFGDDTLDGGAGNDTLQGTAGSDYLFGGDGDDVYYVDSIADVVVESSATGGYDWVSSSISWTLDDYQEKLTLTGTGDINGFGNDLNNVIYGNSATNLLSGGAGNDYMHDGSSGSEDRLDGGAGNDTMEGGLGNDIYFVDSTADKIVDMAGIDEVHSSVTRTLGSSLEHLYLTGNGAIDGYGNALGNHIYGNSAANRLYGSAGADVLYGGAGDDRLDGGGDNDSLFGGLGNDIYYVDSTYDKVIESSSTAGGVDWIYSSVTRTLGYFQEHLYLTGDATIHGFGNDLGNGIYGNSATNLLSGGAGNDALLGRAGNDVLVGGAGKDNFYFDTALSADTNRDRIEDFVVADDTIRLQDAVFSALPTGLLAADAFWSASAASGAHDTSDRVIYNTTTGALYYDADGSGTAATAVQFATLTGSPDFVTNADFVVI
jgi:Ca2+-binding RTX toxin-like protein